MTMAMEETIQAQAGEQVLWNFTVPQTWQGGVIRVVVLSENKAEEPAPAHLSAESTKASDPFKPFDRSHPLPLPADMETWQERFKRLGIGPDDWKSAIGCAKGSNFTSEALFAERRHEVELEETKYKRMFQKEQAAE
jgi:hypothetical protein